MKSYMNCPHCGQEIEILTFSDNTRPASPRFTAEEREAMETLVSFTGSAQKWMNMQNLNRSLSAIATVRKMLTASEIADKGKG